MRGQIRNSVTAVGGGRRKINHGLSPRPGRARDARRGALGTPLGHAEVIIQPRQRLGRNHPKHAEGHRTLGGSEGQAAIRR